MSALSDLLNSGNVSARQAADRAEAHGVKLPYGTIAAYWSGRHGKPSASTLSRLALVVPFTEKQLQEAAWNTTAPLGPYSPPHEAVHLDQRQRQAVDELIRSIVANRGANDDVETTTQQDARGEKSEVQKTKVTQIRPKGGATGSDAGTDPEGKAADDARQSVWRDDPTQELPPEDPADAWAARKRDPQFPPEDPDER